LRGELGGGFIGWLTLPVAQLLSKGALSITLAGEEYFRFWLLAGIAGIYGGMAAEGVLERLKKAIERPGQLTIEREHLPTLKRRTAPTDGPADKGMTG
jgi:hypothetical protein